MPLRFTSTHGMQWYTLALRSCRAGAYRVARRLPFSEVCCSGGRTLSSEGAAGVGPGAATTSVASTTAANPRRNIWAIRWAGREMFISAPLSTASATLRSACDIRGLESRGGPGRRPDDTPGADSVTAMSALQDGLLADGDGLAPPTLVTGQSNVLTRHAGGAAFLVPGREKEMLPGGEVGGVLLPRRPFVARRATRQHEQHACPKQEFPVVDAHSGHPPEEGRLCRRSIAAEPGQAPCYLRLC